MNIYGNISPSKINITVINNNNKYYKRTRETCDEPVSKRIKNSEGRAIETCYPDPLKIEFDSFIAQQVGDRENVTLRFSDATYKGKVQANLPHGKGTLTVHKKSLLVSTIEGIWERGVFIDGTQTLISGRTYDGIWKKGELWQGSCLLPNGMHYHNCDFQKYEPHGFGELENKCASGKDLLSYKGNFQEGVRHYDGESTYADGRQYQGSYIADLEEGEGRMLYPSNSSIVSYEGEWSTGVKNGYGTEKYRNGGEYVGEFKEGLPHGLGVFKNPTSQDDLIYFEGESLHGLRHAGESRYRDGRVYNGDYLGVEHGEGTMTYPMGHLILAYHGDWVHGMKEGNAIEEYAGGGVYIGQFKNGLPNGYGTYSNKARGATFNEYTGWHVNGQFHGWGRLALTNGVILDGNFVNGKFVGSQKDVDALEALTSLI